MRRIVMLLTVVALMVGMLAMSVAPAFAATFDTYGCHVSDRYLTFHYTNSTSYLDHNDDGIICQYYYPSRGTWRDADNNASKVFLT